MLQLRTSFILDRNMAILSNSLAQSRQRMCWLRKERRAYLTTAKYCAGVISSMRSLGDWLLWATIAVLLQPEESFRRVPTWISLPLWVDSDNCCCPSLYSNRINIRQRRIVVFGIEFESSSSKDYSIHIGKFILQRPWKDSQFRPLKREKERMQ